jgi:spore coat protein U-like protein
MDVPMHLRFRALFGAALLLSGPLAQAATPPVAGTAQATSMVPPSCVIQSLDNLIFGAYDPTSGMDSTALGQLALHCVKGTVVSSVPTAGGAQLRNGSATLSYALYADAALSKVWGGTTSATFRPGTSTTYFSQQLSEAQFKANPNLANQAYGYLRVTHQIPGQVTTVSTTYYVGYLGQTPPPAGTPSIAYAPVSIGSISYAATTNPSSLATTYSNNNVGGVGGRNDLYAQYLVTPTPVAPVNNVYTISSGTLPLGGTSKGIVTDLTLPYYGKLPAGQDVTPGTYADTVTITVTF